MEELLKMDFDDVVHELAGGQYVDPLDPDEPRINLLALREYLREHNKTGDQLTDEEKEMFIIKEEQKKAL